MRLMLDEGDHEMAKKKAKALGISVAEFVRRAIRQSLGSMSDKPWMRYAGLVESGNAKSSQEIDQIVDGAQRIECDVDPALLVGLLDKTDSRHPMIRGCLRTSQGRRYSFWRLWLSFLR
jgi:hypothetical protein